MAFVPVGGASSGASSFVGSAVTCKQVNPSTCGDAHSQWSMITDLERKSFAKIGKGSKWRENQFVGGFPGGEEFYLSWVEEGMTEEVPDLPDFLQSKTPFKESKDSTKRTGILDIVDKIEFFKGFTRDDSEDTESSEVPEQETPEPAIPDSEGPEESLYSKYFPAKVLNVAPKIIFDYKRSDNDRVGIVMEEVTASATDVYYRKEIKNKAPIIDIQYSPRYPNSGSISLKFDTVEGPPTLPPPQLEGEAVTELVSGSGGGLKLQFSVKGGGSINI